MKHRCLRSIAAVLVLAGCWGSVGVAATRDWGGKTDTDWFTSGNWDPSGSPMAADVLNVWSAPFGNLPVASGAAVYTGGGPGRISVRNPTISATFSDDLYVGWAGRGELLIEDGGTVTSWATFIGNHTLGGRGIVTVSGSGSVLDNSTGIYVGYDGAGAADDGTLIVDKGGRVSSGAGYIGHGPASTDNAVTVGGRDSTWTTNGDLLYVGYHGSGELSVEDGGRVSTGEVSIGRFDDSAGSAVTVTGTDSTWDTDGESFTVGYQGSGTLTVENGGLVTSGAGYVGLNATSSGNAVIVTGTGSTWDTNGDEAIVGFDGSGAITIADGGSIVSGAGYIGHFSASVGNVVTVTGASSTWDTGGNDLYVGYRGSGELSVEDGGHVITGEAAIGYSGDSTGNAVTVTGTGSTWDTNGESLTVGYHGSGTLSIENGGLVSSGLSYLGRFELSTGSTATVSGTGSTWDTNGAHMVVGDQGSGTLIIEGGGLVTSGVGYVGLNATSSGNAVTVTGDGSTWDTNGYEVIVGFDGSGAITIADGGSIVSGAGYIGHFSASSGNVVTVTGAGSTWDTDGNDLYVGYRGSGTLDITDGATVSSGAGYIGRLASSSGNRVYLVGAGSTWDTNGNSLYVGGLLG
ncbi:MAG: hypothetical protein WBF17_09975, partial [Phycisphaerae bacterium]